MTHKEILEKAIQKAIEGGWRPWWFRAYMLVSDPSQKTLEHMAHTTIEKMPCVEFLIFNHDFAKALWGETAVQPMTGKKPQVSEKDGVISVDFQIERYKYHLQQMVISDDPLKYLGDNM